jgi:glutamyl/glutaminyl-tRNA synthetase
MVDAGLGDSPIVQASASFHRLLELLRPRAKRLNDFVEQARPLLTSPVIYEPEAVQKHLAAGSVREDVAAVAAALHSQSPFDEPHVETAVRTAAAQRGIKAAQLIHAIRVALTGRTASPGLFELVVLLGRDETSTRLQRLVAFLDARK